jgi:prolyl-tRNA synthetase
MEAPTLLPEELVMDQDHINQMNKELENAQNLVLPEGDDEDF